jgi:hypothetical protein
MPLYSDFKSAKIVKFKNVAISIFENDFGFFKSSHFRFFIPFCPAIRSIFFRVLRLRVPQPSSPKKGCRCYQGYERRFCFQNFVPLAHKQKKE